MLIRLGIKTKNIQNFRSQILLQGDATNLITRTHIAEPTSVPTTQ